MPSKGVAHRHSQRKTKRNRLKLERRAGGQMMVVVPVGNRCEVCGFIAKSARGLATHRTRKHKEKEG